MGSDGTSWWTQRAWWYLIGASSTCHLIHVGEIYGHLIDMLFCIFYLIWNLCWRKKSWLWLRLFSLYSCGIAAFWISLKDGLHVIHVHFWRVSRLSTVWNIKSFQTAAVLNSSVYLESDWIKAVCLAYHCCSRQLSYLLLCRWFCEGFGVPKLGVFRKRIKWSCLEWHLQWIHFCFKDT